MSLVSPVATPRVRSAMKSEIISNYAHFFEPRGAEVPSQPLFEDSLHPASLVVTSSSSQ